MDGPTQALIAAVASFIFVAVILACVFSAFRFRSKSRSTDRSPYPTRARRNFPPPPPKPNSNLPAVSRVSSVSESATFDPNLEQVSMKKLVDVTRGFAPELIIGDGSFGLVYKARLNSGVVAVKKLSPDAFQGPREFRAEMETLGKIQHPNIVKILGYCSTGTDRVLIYEFIEKGSLDQWLYDTSSSDQDFPRSPLSWNNRMKIIRGVARGLAYMHNLEIPIIHRDIKASNILLDANFEAHIADFGLARRMEGSHSHVSTQVAGTMGYMPPEYLHGAKATMQGDVYSFGVLMLEIVTGRRASFPVTGEDKREVRLIEWINKKVVQSRYMEMVDVSISRDDLDENLVIEIFNIGLKCAVENSKLRLTMLEVVDRLDKIVPELEIPGSNDSC